MAPKNLQKLIDRVADLKAETKDANAELKEAVEETPLYKAFLDAIKETTGVSDKVPDKVAAANAFKLTLAMLTKKEEEGEDA